VKNRGCIVGNPDIERQRNWDRKFDECADAKEQRNYGPIMVQQLFPNALNATLEAIRVA
jgi:hypothetical protein